MKYSKTVKANFISRPNRFIANVRLTDGTVTDVHVKNTGRLREILVPGAVVYLEDFKDNMRTRKMRYDLIGVEKELNDGERIMINIDSQAPNKVILEALRNGKIHPDGFGRLTTIRPETGYGESRFDFFIEDDNSKKAFIEVKGVTLENGGIASFPDAVTERGAKHLRELATALKEGYDAFIIFVIQMKGMKYFTTADEHDEVFGRTLREAEGLGVKVLCFECDVTKDTLNISDPLEYRANERVL